MNAVEVDVQLYLRCRICHETDGRFRISAALLAIVEKTCGIVIDPFDSLSQLICGTCQQDVLTLDDRNQRLREDYPTLLERASKTHSKVSYLLLERKNVPERNINGPNSENIRTENKVTVYIPIFKCRLCGLTFINREMVIYHQRTHNQILDKLKEVTNKNCLVAMDRIEKGMKGVFDSSLVRLKHDSFVSTTADTLYTKIFTPDIMRLNRKIGPKSKVKHNTNSRPLRKLKPSINLKALRKLSEPDETALSGIVQNVLENKLKKEQGKSRIEEYNLDVTKYLLKNGIKINWTHSVGKLLSSVRFARIAPDEDPMQGYNVVGTPEGSEKQFNNYTKDELKLMVKSVDTQQCTMIDNINIKPDPDGPTANAVAFEVEPLIVSSNEELKIKTEPMDSESGEVVDQMDRFSGEPNNLVTQTVFIKSEYIDREDSVSNESQSLRFSGESTPRTRKKKPKYLVPSDEEANSDDPEWVDKDSVSFQEKKRIRRSSKSTAAEQSLSDQCVITLNESISPDMSQWKHLKNAITIDLACPSMAKTSTQKPLQYLTALFKLYRLFFELQLFPDMKNLVAYSCQIESRTGAVENYDVKLLIRGSKLCLKVSDDFSRTLIVLKQPAYWQWQLIQSFLTEQVAKLVKAYSPDKTEERSIKLFFDLARSIKVVDNLNTHTKYQCAGHGKG